jgi:ATP-dependent Lhr-like helicase
MEVVQVDLDKSMEFFVEAVTVGDEDRTLASTLTCDVASAAMLRRCREIVESHASTLIFVNTRNTAEVLAARFRLTGLGETIGVHHGSLSKEVRVEMEDRFKAGTLKALICTSSLELGIDIGAVDCVIQYNSPRQVSRLLQRSGRSGHSVGRVSRCFILSQHFDELSEAAVVVEGAMRRAAEPVRLRPNPLSVVANQILSTVSADREVEPAVLHKVFTRAHPFSTLTYERFMQVVLFLESLRLVMVRGNLLVRRRRTFEYFLDNISMIADERSFRVIDLASRRTVGTLDEAFVASFAHHGATFVMRGETWRVLEIK